MHTTKRQHGTDVIARLLAAPYQYRFAQLLNILLRLLREQGISDRQAFSEVLRFRNSLSLAFPPSEIASMQVDTANGLRAYITPAFIGLLGANGTLPLHDTERAAAKTHLNADESWKPFIDLFSNRAIGLFYEAWGKYRVEHTLATRARDDLLPMLRSLAGQPTFSSEMPPEIAGFYAGLLRTRPIAASTVEQVLAEHFGVPARIEQFAGTWDSIPEKKRSTLGVTDPVLGCGAVLGTRLWRKDLRVRILIGPLDDEQAQSFLPQGAARATLREMVGLFAVPSLQYEVRLLLGTPCINPLSLRTKGIGKKRLGWNSFLTGQQGKTDRPEIRFTLQLRT